MGIPVILDTDIGHDVDDVWALVFLLRCPELDVKLITTTTGDTLYRARLTAKVLETLGFSHIPVGVGIPLDDNPHTHDEWLGEYDLGRYPGEVVQDGIGALCETIMASEQQVTLICIGPLPNIAAALSREPDIAKKAKFVGMHGSIRKGYAGAPKPMREFNVKLHTLSCRAVFEAEWEKVITPLDTCGDIILDGDRFALIKEVAEREGPDSPPGICIANHDAWFRAITNGASIKKMDPNKQSSILYDLVAIYLGFAENWLEMEELEIKITPDGKTVEDHEGDTVRCAMNWKNRPAFLDMVTRRLTEPAA